MKITPIVRYAKFRSKRNFGIELEFNQKLSSNDLVKIVTLADKDRAVMKSDHYEQDYNNNFWHVKFDRSCGDIANQGGWEVASYKANGYKDVNKMGVVTDALKKGGAAINNECGFHIHVEIADFNVNQAATLVANWIKIEQVVIEMCPRHRRANKYCKLLSKKYDFYDHYYSSAKEFWALVRPQRADNTNRRVSLNMCNYAEWVPNRKTVELRLPEGTLESKDVKNWIRFFMCFVDSCKKADFPKNTLPVSVYEAMNIVGLHSENPFLILSGALRETKIWFMDRLLLYSGKKKYREEAQMFLNALEVEPKVYEDIETPEPIKLRGI